MTENVYCLSRIRNGEEQLPHWPATVTNFLVNDGTYRNKGASENFKDVLFPSKLKKYDYLKPCLAKEVKITEGRRIIREEKFQHLSKEKQGRIIEHELVQIRDNLENGRLLRKMQLEDIEELAELRRKRRENRDASFKGKARAYNFPGNQRRQRPTSNANDGVSVEQNISLIRNRKASIFASVNCRESVEGSKSNKEVKINSKTQRCPTSNCEIVCDTTGKGGIRHMPEDAKPEEKRSNREYYPTPRDAREEAKEKEDLERRLRLIKTYFEHRVKKYIFSQWRQFTNIKKSEKHEEMIWQEKINVFMKRLNTISTEQKVISSQSKKVIRTKTAPIMVRQKDYRKADTYQESADKELEELSQAVAKSTSETREKLMSKSVLRLDPSLRGRAKLIRVQTISNSNEDKLEEHTTLQFPKPMFLLEMAQKQEERNTRLRELREKRKALEEAKIQETKLKMERYIREEEEEKRRKLREFREKVKLQKIEQEKRKQECLLLKSLMINAAQYYRNKLLSQYGLIPWMHLMVIRKNQIAEAEKQNKRRIKRQVLTSWKFNIEELTEERERKAILHWRKTFLRHCLAAWYQILIKIRIQHQVAEDWNDYLIVRRGFQKWQSFMFIEQFEHEQKWKIAVEHFKSKEATKYLKHWMLLPQVLYLEREKERRKQQWRQIVQQVLPDFRPLPTKEL